MKQSLQSLWSSLQNNYKNNSNKNKNKKRNINGNFLSFPVESDDIHGQKSPPENLNKKIKKTVVHYSIPSDTESDEEAAIQSAIISSLRTLEQEQDKKQKTVVPASYTTLTLVSSFQSLELEAGSTSSLPTCAVCHDVIAHHSIVRIYPCNHLSCSSCISRYIGEKVNLDIRNVVCPEETCGRFLRKRFVERWAPKEVYERLRNAVIEASVLKYTFRLACPFEGCGRKFVDDERGYRIRACTWCWRLFCCKCWEGWHMGMTCKQFKRREEEAEWRRERIVWRREEEEREKKQDKKNVGIAKGEDLLLS